MPWFPPVQLAFRTFVGVTHWTNYIFHNPGYLKGRVLWQYPPQALLPGRGSTGEVGPTGPEPNTAAEWLRSYKLDFPKSGDAHVYQQFACPPDFIGNGTGDVNIAVLVYWNSAEVTGNVRWRVRARAVAEGENWNESSAWDAEASETDAVQDMAGELSVAVWTLTVTGLTARDLVGIEISRDVGHAEDTALEAATLIYTQGETG